MKNLKRIASLLLALVIVLAMMMPAFADGTQTTTNPGSITINDVELDAEGKLTNKYILYKMLDLESYIDTEEGEAYSYKVNDAWAGFFATDAAKAYLSVDEQGYVTWKKEASEAPADVAAFAKAALAYAEANKIPAVTSSDEGYTPGIATDSENNQIHTITFENLELGYYLIDSTMGALCGLTTTNPNASIKAKNAAPTVDKQVKEDSTNNWGNNNTADIGQEVEFRTTISVHAGAQNYVLHDKMSEGLTFVPDSVSGYHVVPGTTDEIGKVIPVAYYTVEYNEDGSALEDGCTFEVKFTQAFCDHLQTNDKVIVYYKGILNEKAVIAGEGNTNESWLEFGVDHETTHDTTTTKTYGFDLIKTDSANKLIDGAEFRIYDAAEGGTEIAVVAHQTGKTEAGEERVIAYRRAKEGETGVSIVVKNGAVRVVGLDNGTYYLEETVVPTGYNQLSARQPFTISDGNLNSIFNDKVYSTGSGVQVVNKSGTMLPETGGIGTTIFYAAGGLLVAAAVVLLVTRKRMRGEEE